MSGAIAAQFLHERFAQVRADEWRRPEKKVAHLDSLQRHEVEPIGDIALRLCGASHSMWSVGPVSDTQ